MSFETDLVAWLEANIAAAGTRIYPVMLPQDAVLPALTYFRVDGVREYSHSGYSNYITARFRLTCWAGDPADVRALVAELKSDLDAFSGTMGATAVGLITYASETEMRDPDMDAFYTPVDFLCRYAEV